MTADRVALARQTHGGMLTARLEEAADGLDDLVQRLRALADKDVPLVGTEPTAKTGAGIAQEALKLYIAATGNLPLAAISRAGTEYDRALATVIARQAGELDETAQALADQSRRVYEVYDGRIPSGWSLTEQLAVAVVLYDLECLRAHEVTRRQAERLLSEEIDPSIDLPGWLDGVRATLVADRVPVYPPAPVESDLQEMEDQTLGNLGFQPTRAQLRQVWRENPWMVVLGRSETWSDTEAREQLCAALTELRERSA